MLELYSDNAYVTESEADWARIHAEMLGVRYKPAPYESLNAPVGPRLPYTSSVDTCTYF